VIDFFQGKLKVDTEFTFVLQVIPSNEYDDILDRESEFMDYLIDNVEPVIRNMDSTELQSYQTDSFDGFKIPLKKWISFGLDHSIIPNYMPTDYPIDVQVFGLDDKNNFEVAILSYVVLTDTSFLMGSESPVSLFGNDFTGFRQFGLAEIPTLVIKYSDNLSQLSEIGISFLSIGLPTIVVVIPALFYIFKKAKQSID